MKATISPIYRWRVGEVEITRVLKFEAALFEPAVIHPEASPEIIERHRAWLEPTLMDPVSGHMIFAFYSTVIKTPRATHRRSGASSRTMAWGLVSGCCFNGF